MLNNKINISIVNKELSAPMRKSNCKMKEKVISVPAIDRVKLVEILKSKCFLVKPYKARVRITVSKTINVA